MDFRKILSDKRIPVDTPDNIIDKDGKAVFGTFKSEFRKMDFLDIKGQSCVPDRFNKFRYTMWEAVEVNLKDALFLTAVCDMGWFTTGLTCFYDKKTKKLTWWKKTLGHKKIKISYNLLDGDTSFCNHENLNIKIVNHFERGNAYISGDASHEKKGNIKYDITLERVSLPSVVSIPFGENKPLYTQKDLFKATGYVEINGKRYECDDDSAGIIDDHRGYYPYKSHYDWVTTMGKKEIDGNVYALQKDVDALNLKASQLKNALCGYSSVDEINSKINSTDSQITKLQSELVEVEAEANSTQLGSLDDVINELLSADIFKFVLRNSTVLSELLKNSAVLKSVMNDTSLVSKLYGVKLPQNIIDQLEGTDDKLYFVHKKDCRTEAQIVADFEKYFASAFFADYEIARDVDPTYFGAHPKCKPIQFLFKKNGKDVLAVAILKYSSLTHPAVKNVKESCKNRRIPYLQFIVGYPNKEHYVVRRALEELGEIDYLYADYYWQRWPMKQLENLAKEIDNKEVWERVEFRKKHRINL